jgi:hypothetical protein
VCLAVSLHLVLRRNVDQYFLDRFAFEVGDETVGRGIANRNENVGTFVAGPPEELAQKAHRIGGMGECDQAGEAETRQQEADGDTGRFGHVGVLDASLGAIDIARESIRLTKDDDKVGRGRDVVFDPIGPEGSKICSPLRWENFISSLATAYLARFE